MILPPRLPPPPPRERNDDDCATAFLCLKRNRDVPGCCPVREKSPCIGEDVSKCMRYGDTQKIREFFLCSLTNKQKEKREKKRSNLSLLFGQTHMRRCKQSHLSLSLSFFLPSAQTAKREEGERMKKKKKKYRERKGASMTKKKGLRPVTIGWCEQ